MKCEEPTEKNPGGRTGTYNGYAAHRDAKEPPCEPCLEAGRAYIREARKKFYHRTPAEKYVSIHRRAGKVKSARRAPYSAKKITETFGAFCHLCGEAVLLNDGISRKSPLAAVVDHVVPLRFEEGPGDQLSNVRWSHRRCKERRGNRTMGDCDTPYKYPGDKNDPNDPINRITEKEMSSNG